MAEASLSAPSANESSSSGGSSDGAIDGPVNPAKGGGGAFNALAGYIFGGNSRKEKMAMTTPVFSDSNGRMQFVVRSSDEVYSACRLTSRPCQSPHEHCARCMSSNVSHALHNSRSSCPRLEEI